MRLLALGLLLFFGLQHQALGHGGVSIEDDVCIITLDNYRAHFTAYMPEKRSVQEFCETLPVTGRAIITIDFVSGELRRHKISFEVLRDFTGKEAKATAIDLNDASEDVYNRNLVHSDVGAVHRNGTINFPVEVASKGWYIGVMRVYDDAGVIAESVFPFEVAPSKVWQYMLIIPAVLAGVFMLFRLFDK